MALCGFFTLFAEEQHLVVQEDVPLHRLESCKVLHFIVTSFMVCPHVKGTLHEQLPEVSEVTLNKVRYKCILE